MKTDVFTLQTAKNEVTPSVTKQQNGKRGSPWQRELAIRRARVRQGNTKHAAACTQCPQQASEPEAKAHGRKLLVNPESSGGPDRRCETIVQAYCTLKSWTLLLLHWRYSRGCQFFKVYKLYKNLIRSHFLQKQTFFKICIRFCRNKTLFLYRDQMVTLYAVKIFPWNRSIWVWKKIVFLCRFQKSKLTLVTKCP
jgi:hypothetical protein